MSKCERCEILELERNTAKEMMGLAAGHLATAQAEVERLSEHRAALCDMGDAVAKSLNIVCNSAPGTWPEHAHASWKGWVDLVEAAETSHGQVDDG